MTQQTVPAQDGPVPAEEAPALDVEVRPTFHEQFAILAQTRGDVDALIEVGVPALAVDTTARRIDVPRITHTDEAQRFSADPLPAVVSPQLKSPTSGGSTGRPKLIVSGAEGDPTAIALLGTVMGVPENDVCLITAALYHNASFSNALAALTLGNTPVLMERFDPETTLRMIEQHRAGWGRR